MERMNLLMTAFSIVLLCLSCSQDDTLRGSGNIVSESRNLANFTQVYNPTSVNIIIMEGSPQQVKLSADDNVISSIKTIVENGTLKIDMPKSTYVDVMITVSVTIPNLEGLKNTGSGNMTSAGFDGLTSMTIDNEGSGNVVFTSSGTSLTLKNSGSGSFQGFNFMVENCTVANSGSGNCEINCSDILRGTNSGSGSIFYKGTPTLDVSNTGSGEVVDSN